MLFRTKKNSHHSLNVFTQAQGNQPPAQPTVIVMQQPAPRLPKFMLELPVLCTKHPISLLMKCIGTGVSRTGSPQAIYACTAHGCQHREGWVIDRHTGKPMRLWYK
ncbi:MAG: hypothetical protein HPY51_09080 [Candidatus Omnitrophica bacterium]|nr:hypothetical protein [Candidatus Omnitrophota bacterium]